MHEYKGFGYSGTINTDKKSKLIRNVYVTPANILDFKALDPVLLGDEKEISRLCTLPQKFI